MKNKPDNAMISRYTYNVNNLGQRTAVTTAGEAFDTASPADWTWSYDVLGQVKSANQDTYSYDQIGNRISSQKGNSPELSYTSNGLNQYTVIEGSLTPSYDADGNQLGGLMPTAELPERGQLTFTYNAHNRPISVTKNDANNTILENYTHDHEGRRIQEGNTITIYDGYNAIAEYTVNGVLKITYAWGLDLSNTLQGAGGVGGLLSVTDYTGQLPLISYPTYDGNGNVTEYVTEANNGTIATHYEYDSFGNVIRNTMNRNYRYQFSTKPYNKLTGLNYYNYRDYDPVSGRWTSPDPIEEQGGLNLYGFVGNDAISYLDILGGRRAGTVARANLIKPFRQAQVKVNRQINARNRPPKGFEPPPVPRAPGSPSTATGSMENMGGKVKDFVEGIMKGIDQMLKGCEERQHEQAISQCNRSAKMDDCPKCCIITIHCYNGFATGPSPFGSLHEKPCSEVPDSLKSALEVNSETYTVSM